MSDNKETSVTDLRRPKSKFDWWPTVRHFIAGSASGVALVLAGHSFDTIKVRLQTDTEGRFKGVLDCLFKTVREEGIRGLYKGASPPMIATGFINSVMFGLMGICSSKMRKDENTPLTIPQIMWCGSSTGFFMSFIVTPIEGIKARLQVQYAQTKLGGKPQYAGPIDCAQQLYRNNGIRGLYIGWLPTVFHRGSNWSYFGAYELVKRKLTSEENKGKLSPLASITAGACAGTSFWLSCYPIDVIKNRMQTAPNIPGQPPKYKGMIDCARQIWVKEGWRAYLKGLTPCLIRSVPANSAAFFAFEVVHSALPAKI